MTLRFAHDRVVANPAVTFFHTPMLTSRDAGGRGGRDDADPVERRLRGLLDRGQGNPRLSACLAALGIGHVLLAEEADWRRSPSVEHRRALVVERRWSTLPLLRNPAPAGLVMAGGGRGS